MQSGSPLALLNLVEPLSSQGRFAQDNRAPGQLHPHLAALYVINGDPVRARAAAASGTSEPDVNARRPWEMVSQAWIALADGQYQQAAELWRRDGEQSACPVCSLWLAGMTYDREGADRDDEAVQERASPRGRWVFPSGGGHPGTLLASAPGWTGWSLIVRNGERRMNEDRISERDQERNEDPERMAGAVGGAAGAGTGAAAGLAVLGPVGGVIGLLAGAAGGWWSGRELMKAVEDVDRDDSRFRRTHEHAGAARPYEEARHAYHLGYLAGRNPDYADTQFPDIEGDLRAAWVQAHLHDRTLVPWDDVRTDVKTGYELARQRD